MVTKTELAATRRMHKVLKNSARAWQAWLLTLALGVAVYHIAPQQIGILPYKMCFITIGMLLAYWIFTWLFGHLDEQPNDMRHPFVYCRTFIMGMAMIALALAA